METSNSRNELTTLLQTSFASLGYKLPSADELVRRLMPNGINIKG